MTKRKRRAPKIIGISKPTNLACIGCKKCSDCVACYKCNRFYDSISTQYSDHSVSLNHSIFCTCCYFSDYLLVCSYCYHSVDLENCQACLRLYKSKYCYRCKNSVLLENKMWLNGEDNA